MSRTWEYRLLSSEDLGDRGFLGTKPASRDVIERYLNQLGADGWEIIGIDFHDPSESPQFFQALARRER